MQIVIWLAILVAVTSFISSQSTTKLGTYLWDVYLNFSSNETVVQVKESRAKLAEVKHRRSQVSSKDEFAKWAKLDREHRKLKQQIDQCNQTLAQSRQSLHQATRIIRWTSTTGLKLFVQWRFRKVPVVYLPKNVLPSTVEWFLSLPSAPKGTISVATWIAITSVVFGKVASGIKYVKSKEGIKQ